jgi:hypothetical protein
MLERVSAERVEQPALGAGAPPGRTASRSRTSAAERAGLGPAIGVETPVGGVSGLVTQLQRAAGNAATAAAVQRHATSARDADGGTWLAGLHWGVDAVTALLAGQIRAAVGRGGDNSAADVMVVRALLGRAGYTAPAVETAIERYQREVVGLRSPDGRVDPDGRTIKALRAGRGSAARPSGPGVPGPRDPAAPTATAPADPAPGHRPPPAVPREPSGGAAPTSAADIRAMVADMAQAARAAKKDSTEAIGSQRDALISRIPQVRGLVGRLHDAQERAALYGELNAIAPSYYQSKNMDLLEMPPPQDTRTCNLTSVAMCLEALGKTAADYTGDRRAVVAVAGVYAHVVALAEDAGDKSGDRLDDLRLPDFLQLAAIAEVVGSAALTKENIADAAVRTRVEKGKVQIIGGAWKKITEMGFLRRLPERFGGVTAVAFESEHSAALTRLGHAHRSQVERLADLRNDRERLRTMTPGTTAYEKLQAAITKAERSTASYDALSRRNLADHEEDLPLQQYRDSVMSTLGLELAKGNQVVANLYNHYVRLESVGQEQVVVDDPARGARANRKLTWEEARAMGYFRKAIILR